MAWYKIIAALKEYLAVAQVARVVEVGALDPESLDLAPSEDGRYGAVFLVRGKEEEEELFHGGEGTAYFYAENWVRSDDPDPAEGYRLLAEQEARCKEAMAAFFITGEPTPGVDLVYASLKETIGDADSVRPRVGSRMTVKVQWSMRTL